MFNTLNCLGPETGLEVATSSPLDQWPVAANGLIGGWLTALVSLCNGTWWQWVMFLG